MPAILIETGYEEHPSSNALLSAKYRNGEHNGKSLSDIKDRRKSSSFEKKGRSGWTTAEYDIPEGTLIEIRGKGLKERNLFSFHRIYLINSDASPIEEIIDIGIHKCILKGKLSLFRDFVAEYEASRK